MSDEIFMVHGMFCKGSSWDNYRGFFEKQNYHCITPTLRYHDISPLDKPDPRLGTTSLLDYVDDLQKEIEILKEPPVIMGHSMGGLIAQILASRGLGKALVLLTPAASRGSTPMFNPFVWASALRAWGSVLVRPGYSRKPFRISYSALNTAWQPLSENERRDEYGKLVYESGKVLNEIGFGKQAAAVDESKLAIPVLIISGKLDRLVPNESIRNMARKYGERCNYKEFEDHSHWVLGGPRWEEVANYVNEWLNLKLQRHK
jgi:pimeloyl-ACP methyl ester carboxylesterase